MVIPNVCRFCMETTCLNPIFNESKGCYSPQIIYIVSGVKVEPYDELPQNMCSICTKFLNQCLDFRDKCKRSESKLIKLKNNLNPHINSDHASKTIQSTAKKKWKKYREIEKDKIITQNAEDDTEDAFDVDDEKPLKYFVNEDEYDNEVKNITVYIPTDENNVESVKEENENCVEIAALDKRRIGKTDVKQRRVTCKICQKDLSIRSIDAHMVRSHPGADDRKVKCDLCDNYVLKQKLSKHKLFVHGSASKICAYCKFEFENKEMLVDHVKTCSAKKKKRKSCDSSRVLRECDICHKKMQKASLRMHKAIKHAGLGPVCKHCGRKFGNKLRLDEHCRAKHGYEKFKCIYCDFQSAGAMSMRNHERRHRGEKPYICERCGAKFHAAYLLAQHRQSHRTEKLVKCDQCPARFKANNSLHMHKSACHSAARYGCGVCARVYSCRHYARRHLRIAHRRTQPHNAAPALLRLPPASEEMT